MFNKFIVTHIFARSLMRLAGFLLRVNSAVKSLFSLAVRAFVRGGGGVSISVEAIGAKPHYSKLVKHTFACLFSSTRLAGCCFLLPLILVSCGGGGGSSSGGGGGVAAPPPQDVTIPAPRDSNGRSYGDAEYRRVGGLQIIRADVAYQRGYFGQDVVVGVIDTGLRTTHREFTGNLVTGHDFVFPNNSVIDQDGHGTAVAAVIAGRRNTNGTMHGVAYEAKIMPLKTGDDSGKLVGDSIAAIRYAVARNVPIINNSYGQENRLVGTYMRQSYAVNVPFFRGQDSALSRSRARTIAAAVSGRDVMMVWAAGNDGWHDNGRIGIARITACKDKLLNLKDCTIQSEESAIKITPRQLTDGFVSENYADELDNFKEGIGALNLVDGSGSRTSSFESTLPYRAGNTNDFLILSRRWLVAVALNNRNSIAEYSNPCGGAKDWCLSAPGNAYTADTSSGDVGYNNYMGTSFAAPYISGALAVLKSRLPSMPMYVIRDILLTTAIDLGDAGVDSIYGHGMLDLGAAAIFQGQVRFSSSSSSTQSASSTSSKNINVGHVSPENARLVLPAAMGGLKTQLAAVSVAVELPGNLRYNMPLSEIVEVDSPSMHLGDAAADMLEDNAIHGRAGSWFAAVDTKANRFHYVGANIDGGDLGAWQFRHDFCDDCGDSSWNGMDRFAESGDIDSIPSMPFFAKGGDAFMLQMQGDGLRPFMALSRESLSQTTSDSGGDDDLSYRQIGMRWQQENDNFSVLAEVSWIGEHGSFAGARFGALGAADADSGQGVIEMRGSPAKHWRGFARYETAYIKADVKSGGFLSSVDGLRAARWRAGLERAHIFAGGDRARFAVSQDAAIRGRAHFNYLQVKDDVLQSRQTEADLSGGGGFVYALGYAAKLSDKAQAAVAAEWRNASDTANAGAISAQLQIDF